MTEFHLDLADKLPAPIRFGTSSWTYPGWRGTIYRGEYSSEKAFKSDCLSEYGRFPWFRTVGIDSSFYAPPRVSTLQRYATQLPQGFQWISKVWETLTVLKYPAHRRYGARAGSDNEDFLNARLFLDQVLPPFQDADCAAHNGPFVFQFGPLPAASIAADDFYQRLDRFLAALPDDQRYAIEVRNKHLLQPDYFAVLNRHGATHCFNHWTWMPRLLEQMKAAADAGGLQAPFYVARLLTPLRLSYAKSVEKFQPYDRMQAPIPEMRDDVLRFARRAIERDVPAFIVINNRLEGNSPLTIDAIGARLIAMLEAQS